MQSDLRDNRSEEAGCHSELERSGGEESPPPGCWMRDSSAYGLSMTGQQNQCGELRDRLGLVAGGGAGIMVSLLIVVGSHDLRHFDLSLLPYAIVSIFRSSASALRFHDL